MWEQILNCLLFKHHCCYNGTLYMEPHAFVVCLWHISIDHCLQKIDITLHCMRGIFSSLFRKDLKAIVFVNRLCSIWFPYFESTKSEPSIMSFLLLTIMSAATCVLETSRDVQTRRGINVTWDQMTKMTWFWQKFWVWILHVLTTCHYVCIMYFL